MEAIGVKKKANRIPPRDVEAEAANAFERLKLEIRSQEHAVPPGFYTVVQWAMMNQLSPVVARRYLSNGVAMGKVEIQKFRVRISDGRVVPVPHYRILTTRPKGS